MSAAPTALIEISRSMMQGSSGEAAGIWPRACVLLARQALEDALTQLWRMAAPGVESASKKSQLICLGNDPELRVDPQVAARATYAWHALSMFCHDHAYELQPVLSEIGGWLDEVQAFIDAVNRHTPLDSAGAAVLNI